MPYQEAELVARAAEGDAEAFEALYRLHIGDVYSLSLRMLGNPDHAEDACQEIFIRLWKKLDRFGGKSRFQTWLFRLSMNILIREKKQIQKRETLPVTGEEKDLRILPQQRVDLRRDLTRALQILPPKGRAVLILHDIEGLKHREIGKILRISEGTSKAHLHKARCRLKEELDK